jgi:dual specificity tyrosine-phosphorylation-regulated kinase 2/3/4
VKLFPKFLCLYEQIEIQEFKTVYFVNQVNPQQINHEVEELNHGLDDDRGDYNLHSNDHVMYRFEIVQKLGKGSFGQVVKAFDHKVKEYVALKIIRNKKRFHKQGVVEVRVLDHLRTYDDQDNKNVVKMKDYFLWRNHLCITFEMLSINLYEFIKNNNFAGVSQSLIKRFGIQILHCLSYLRRH